MLPQAAVDEIVRIINNPARSTNAFLWLQETLREVQGRGRWKWLLNSGVCNLYASVALPDDYHEAVDPIIYDPATTATDAWAVPTTPWDWSIMQRLEERRGHYAVDRFGLNFSTAFSGGSIWLDYYRKITVPTTVGESTDLDLPDTFAYRLAVYGAARHGLIGEDDYDRLNQAKEQFETALSEMRQWDARRGIANRVSGLQNTAGLLSAPDGPMFPSNYSVI